MIQAPQHVLKEENGKKLVGPSGGSIWSAPVIDEKRRLIYVTTGNGFSGPPEPLTDAIVALDLGSGQVALEQAVRPRRIFSSPVAASRATPTSPAPRTTDPMPISAARRSWRICRTARM